MPPRAAVSPWPPTAFSPDGTQLAVASPDGRLKTFDTGTGRIVLNIAEDGQPAAHRHVANEVASPLFEQHTALAWVTTGGTADRLVVLGTAAGDVKAHSASSGKLVWRASAVSEGGVAAVAWAGGAGRLYAAGADRQIVRLDPTDGAVAGRFEAGRHPLSALAVTPDGGRAFAASATVAAWGLQAERRLFKFTGHPAAARSLTVTEDGQYAASAAAGERHVAVWQATGDSSKKSRSAAGVLSLEHAAVSVGMRSADSDSGASSFFVAAVSEAGEAYVWRCSPAAGDDRRVSSQLLARISVGASREERGGDDGVLAAQLTGGAVGGGAELQLARSSWARPAFRRLSLTADAGSTSIVLPPQQGGLLLPHDASGAGPAAGGTSAKAASRQPQQQHQQQRQPFMLGPDNADQPLQLRGRTADATDAAAAMADAAVRKRRRAGDSDEAVGGDEAFLDAQGFGEAPPSGNGMADGGAPVADFDSSDEEEPSDAEPTLGERVAALRLEEQRRSAAAAGGPADAEQEPREEEESEAPLKAIKADSLAVLLTQALRSEDKALLERCLAVAAPDVITNTVSRLQAPDAALLLRAGVARLQSRPRRGRQLAAWLQALLAAHTAYFIAAPGARTALTALYQCIEARVASRQALTSLAGRLELLAAQPRPGTAAAPAFDLLKPQVVYTAGDTSDDEPTAAGGGGDSDSDSDMSQDGQLGSESWGTDDEESDSQEEEDFIE